MTLLDRAIETMMKTNRTHHRLIEEKVRSVGLHRTSHMVLMYLSHDEDSPSQRELAERLCVTPAAITGILNNLERDGLIRRCSGKDSRTNEIVITDEGRAIVERSRELFFEVDTEMFAGLSEDELLAYISTLEKILSNMEKSKEETK